MGLRIEPYVFSDAVKYFWNTRKAQQDAQRERGARDQGTRSAVTGGKQMDGFLDTMVRLMVQSGVPPGDIYLQRNTTDLPGYFRPTKAWDLVVVSAKRFLAAVEVKSQVGSFGNNFNNRTEEALGCAEDIWTAYREGAFRESTDPWLGYLFLLEDCPRVHQPIDKINEPHFEVFPEFKGASYVKRYELLCRRLVRERKYSAACLLLAERSRANENENYTEPASDLSAAEFLSQMIRRVAPLCPSDG